MSNRVSDAPRSSSRVIFYEDEQQYTETRRTRRPVRDDGYYYEEDERPRRRTDDDAPRRSRRRDDDDVAPRRSRSRDDEDMAPRRSRSRDDDRYVRVDDDRPLRVKVEQDPPKKRGAFASSARTGARIAARVLGIGGFALACIGGLLAVGGTHIIPGFGHVPNIGPGAAVAAVGVGAYVAGGAIEQSLTDK